MIEEKSQKDALVQHTLLSRQVDTFNKLIRVDSLSPESYKPCRKSLFVKRVLQEFLQDTSNIGQPSSVEFASSYSKRQEEPF